MINKFNPSDYCYFQFHLNSSYKSGKGWNLSQEQQEKYYQECNELAIKMGFTLLPFDSILQCVRGYTEMGEYIYFHPIEISGTFLLLNVSKLHKILLDFKSEFFSLNSKRYYNLEPNVKPHEFGYSHNPNVIYEKYVTK